MNKFISASVVILLILTGCATNKGPEYSGQDYNQIKGYEIGVVQEVRPVVISDSGTGTFLGAIIGTVVGSTMGRGNGNTLATLAGGLIGGYAGNEIGKANAQELSVELESGDQIIVVAKGNNIAVGDRVKIIKDGNKVDQVYKID